LITAGKAAAGDIGNEHRRHHRRCQRPRLQIEQTGIADIVEIVAGLLDARAALAVAADGAIDQPRI